MTTPQNTEQLVAEVIRLIKAWEPSKPLIQTGDLDTPQCAGCPDNGPWEGVRACEVQYHDGKLGVVYYCSSCRTEADSPRSDVQILKVYS